MSDAARKNIEVVPRVTVVLPKELKFTHRVSRSTTDTTFKIVLGQKGDLPLVVHFGVEMRVILAYGNANSFVMKVRPVNGVAPRLVAELTSNSQIAIAIITTQGVRPNVIQCCTVVNQCTNGIANGSPTNVTTRFRSPADGIEDPGWTAGRVAAPGDSYALVEQCDHPLRCGRRKSEVVFDTLTQFSKKQSFVVPELLRQK
jgi:hypothetical protein